MLLTFSLIAVLLPTLCSTHLSSFANKPKRSALSTDSSPPSDTSSLTSINPWDDAGRSQILDNEPSTQLWRKCPLFSMNCRKCPLDARCRRRPRPRPRPSFPWWRPVDVLDVPDALMGPVIAGEDDIVKEDDEEEKQYGLHICQAKDCGEGARCVRGYCVCHLGFKGDNRQGAVVRGFDGLHALTVWVDRGIACNAPCETLSCAEVEQVEACFDRRDENVEDENGPYGDSEGDLLETFGVGGRGAINVPSAVRKSEGKYNVRELADPTMVGEAN